ncbi:uncharacterized protein METZ01_LOCUS512055, partial [marine metagenome]
GSVAGCGGPYHDFLSSPDFIVPTDGEVTLSFEHRHAFEANMFDGGQLRIRVNARHPNALHKDVGIAAFTENGYQRAVITGQGIIYGKQAFGLTSEGYARGNYITSVATLGTFAAGDAISIQFLAAYDRCNTGTNPNWVIKSVSSEQSAKGAISLEGSSYIGGLDEPLDSDAFHELITDGTIGQSDNLGSGSGFGAGSNTRVVSIPSGLGEIQGDNLYHSFKALDLSSGQV